jgi:hypothetical protein
MMMRASCSGSEAEDTIGFDDGAGASDAEGAALSPADPKISTRLSKGKNRKLFIARLLLVSLAREKTYQPASGPTIEQISMGGVFLGDSCFRDLSKVIC